MAQLISFFVLYFTIYFSTCHGSLLDDELAQFVLKTFNEKTNSVYLYKSVQAIHGYPLNDSESAYHLQLHFSVGCNSQFISEAECFPKNLICDVTVTKDVATGERKLIDDDTKCSLPPRKEFDEPLTDDKEYVSLHQQKEDIKTMFDDLGPILLKHLNPIPEETSSPLEREPVDVDRRMIQSEETPIEEIVKEPVVEVSMIKKKVYCAGCLIDISTDLPALEGFAEEALAMIDHSTDNLYKHNIVQITKAQKQVVNGIKYILTLEVAETYCLKTSGQDRETCEPNSGGSKMCVVEFLEKPWLQERKIISNNCTQDNNELDNEIIPQFAHKSESDRQSIFDFLDSLDDPVIDHVMDPQIRTDIIPQSEDVEQVLPVENVNSFVQAEQFESNDSFEDDEDTTVPNREIQKKKEDDSDEMSAESDEVNPQVTDTFVGGVFRRKREVLGGNRFGGLKDILATEKKLVHDLAELAIQTLDEIDADDSKRVVLEIIDAKKQLVDGVLYHLKIRVGSTSCSENGAAKSGCIEDLTATPKLCSIQMHRSFAADSPNDVKVVKSECTNEQQGRHRRISKRSIAGGFSPANVSDPYIQGVASFALLEFDKESNSLYKQSIVRIVEAKQQVVSGLNIHLTLELGDSSCRKDEHDRHNGPCLRTDENGDTQVCHIAVWDQPWIKSRHVTNISCDNSSKRSKRSTDRVLGGPSPVDVNDPRIQDMAKFSLAHLDGMSNALYAQKVVKVLHATRQVVQGAKYKITLEIGYTSCRKGQGIDVNTCEFKDDSNNQICVVEIWDRPWLKETRVLSASCTPSVGLKLTKRSLIGGGSHDIHLGMFHEFMTKHSKVYSTKEEMKRRFHIFRANMKKVEMLQKTEQGTATYGPTRFADLTSKEFKKMYLGLNPLLKKQDSVELPMANIPQITLPPDYDWRSYNIVTPVKNQGMCGSCWAFSVTGNVEGQWALRRGQLLSLSEQELVDCDKLDEGCNGGLPENAYKAITTIGGLETEADYPYDGVGEECHFNKSEVKVTVTGGLNITTNETQMAQWLVKNGPISIGINANAMQFYFGGVSHPWKMLCDPSNLDHGVLIVGYGVHKTSIRHKILPYWIVKNSWGSFWGEKGYYRVYRGDGTCGVNQMATSAVVG